MTQVLFGLVAAAAGIAAAVQAAANAGLSSRIGLAPALDHLGLMGMPTEPVSLARLAGLLLVGGGIALPRT